MNEHKEIIPVSVMKQKSGDTVGSSLAARVLNFLETEIASMCSKGFHCTGSSNSLDYMYNKGCPAFVMIS